jgi:uncharacterized membrane protein (UPF0136 family)
MTAAPLSHKIAAGLSALYGLTSLTGGTIGYVKAGSLPSLLAGGGAGLLLLACAFLIFRKPAIGLFGAAVISIALVGRFVTSALNPSTEPGKETANTVALVMTIGGVLVLLSAGLALAVRSRRSGV